MYETLWHITEIRVASLAATHRPATLQTIPMMELFRLRRWFYRDAVLEPTQPHVFGICYTYVTLVYALPEITTTLKILVLDFIMHKERGAFLRIIIIKV